jgi:putative addiction module component (TIGR02574 family)
MNKNRPDAADEVPTLSEEWMQEIARRSDEYRAGKVETISWEEVEARLLAKWGGTP